MAERIDRLRTLLQGCAVDEALLMELLIQAEGMILCYTGLQDLPPQLESILLRLSLCLFRRLGMEGESERREGEILTRLEPLPQAFQTELKRYRVAGVKIC